MPSDSVCFRVMYPVPPRTLLRAHWEVSQNSFLNWLRRIWGILSDAVSNAERLAGPHGLEETCVSNLPESLWGCHTPIRSVQLSRQSQKERAMVQVWGSAKGRKKICFLNAMSVKERHCHFDRNPCLKLSERLFPLHWPNQMQGKHAYLHVYTHVCYYYGQRSKFDPNLNNHIPIKYLNSFSRWWTLSITTLKCSNHK